MELTKDDVRNLAKAIDLDEEMDKVDPIPPVYPREEF